MTNAIAEAAEARLLILGAGSVVDEYYLPALSMMGKLPSVEIVDASSQAISALQQHFPGAQYRCGDYKVLLGDSERRCRHDAVIIALPNALHVEASESALRSGFHVLCEKPLALSVSDCTRLAKIAAENRRHLKVAMSRRYLPALMAAAELIRSDELGVALRIEAIDRTPFLWRPRTFSFFEPAAGGILADMGVHYLDYLGTLIGRLEPVSYEDDARGGVESALTYDLRAGDTSVHMKLSRMAVSGAEIRITCERGVIIIKKKEESKIFIIRGGRKPNEWCFALKHPFTNKNWPLGFHGSFCEMMADFSRAVCGKPSRIADVSEAEAVTRLIEWAYERRRKKAPCNRPNGRRKIESLITGATGFVGGHLLDRLHNCREGAIRVTARSPASCANVARYPVDIASVDLLSKDQVEKAVAGVRIVFHLAYGRDGPNRRQVTVAGTKNLVNAAIANGAEAVVVLSTMYVFGFPRDVEIVDELSPYNPYGGEYGRSKAKMERWCLARARNSANTRIIVLNPTCVFGPRGGAYTTLPIQLARRRQFCWIEEGHGLCNYTYVENLIDALIAASEDTQLNGQRLIINDGWMPWREFFEPLLKELATDVPSYTRADLDRVWGDKPAFSVPDLVRALKSAPQVREVLKRSAVMRTVAEIAGRHGGASLFAACSPPTNSIGSVGIIGTDDRPPLWLAELFPANAARFSAMRAQNLLGWRPRVSLDAAREKTARWLRDAGYYDGEYV